MIDTIRECQKIVRRLLADLARTKASRISNESTKEKVRGVVDGYFRTDRPILLHRLRDEQLFAGIDGHMQDLLRYTHGRTYTARYRETLEAIQHEWEQLEIETIQQFGDLTGGEVPQQTAEEVMIVRTLQQICPSASVCYRQALEDLSSNARVSWRGTATELREALRELLDTLAPDDEVQQSAGFRLEKDAHGPTMKQKAAFILKSRRQPESSRKTVETASEVVEEKVGALVRSVYSRTSGAVHVDQEKEETISIKRFVDVVLVELLEITSP